MPKKAGQCAQALPQPRCRTPPRWAQRIHMHKARGLSTGALHTPGWAHNGSEHPNTHPQPHRPRTWLKVLPLYTPTTEPIISGMMIMLRRWVRTCRL